MARLVAVLVVLAACSRETPSTANRAPAPGSAAIALDAGEPVALVVEGGGNPIDAAVLIPDAAIAVDAGVKPKGKSALRSAVPSRRKVGKAGDVCQCNPERGKQCVAVPCGAGLGCGYPCGVQGCNFVCMTDEDAEEAKFMPRRQSRPRRLPN
jgi:hypothetical protein